MIKILCISSMQPVAPTGVVTYYKKLYKHFQHDPEVSIDTVTIEDASWPGKKISGLVRRSILLLSFKNRKLIKLSVDVNYRLLIFFALRRKRGCEYDLIHAQDILSGNVAKRFYKGKLPLILTCHFNDNPTEEDMLTYGFTERDRKHLDDIYRRQFAEVDKFIFVSKYAYEKSKYLLSETSSAQVIYNGVEFLDVEKGKRDTGTLRISNIGVIEQRKNQKILIPLAKHLINENILDFHITVIGRGMELPHLKTEITEKELGGYFSFPGWKKNVDEYLENSNLYIHTSINDNCPYSLIEAISQKVPSIAFRVGGIPEILDREFLFELNDYESMSAFIIKNRFALDMIAEQQYNKIAGVFSLQNQLAATKKLYLSFAKKEYLMRDKSIGITETTEIR